ncbi:MAG: hypothetical protein Q9160_006795 [Pyrenula sp. 1 TL-2023]
MKVSPRAHFPKCMITLTPPLAIQQLRCFLFNTTYNPTGARLGNKVLRQRLRGPTLAQYYPRRAVTHRDLVDAFKHLDLETWDDEEEDRLESLQVRRMRGKGAPKKKRTKEGKFIATRKGEYKLEDVEVLTRKQSRGAQRGDNRILIRPFIN